MYFFVKLIFFLIIFLEKDNDGLSPLFFAEIYQTREIVLKIKEICLPILKNLELNEEVLKIVKQIYHEENHDFEPINTFDLENELYDYDSYDGEPICEPLLKNYMKPSENNINAEDYHVNLNSFIFLLFFTIFLFYFSISF